MKGNKLFILFMVVCITFSITGCRYKNEYGDWTSHNDSEESDEDEEDYNYEESNDYNEVTDTEEAIMDEYNDTIKPEGLIVVSYDDKDRVISCIDPTTGSYQEVLRIKRDSKINLVWRRHHFGCKLVSSDCSKLAAYRPCSNNEEIHAGWIDENGDFFDVTATLGLQSESNFAERIDYLAEGFLDEYFVFSCNDIYQSVPIDNVSPDAIIDGLPLPVAQKDINGSNITDWIDENTFIANCRSEGIGYNSVIGKINSDEQNFYIPGNTRTNWNGILSPDGTQIAFLSTIGVGEPKIYVTSINGGEPTEVPIDADMRFFNIYANDAYKYSSLSFLADWQ